MGQNVKSQCEVVEADWEKAVTAWLEKSVLLEPATKNEGETNLDMNVGRQRHAESREVDLSFTSLNRTICG